MWKEAVIALFEALLRQLLGETEENREIYQGQNS
jgi:hypothetical protein